MTNRRALPFDAPLLVGRLWFDQSRMDKWPCAPLMIRVYCPYCKTTHSHRWPHQHDNAFLVAHRRAHCGYRSAFFEDGYWIGLDPTMMDEHRRTLEYYWTAAAVLHFNGSWPFELERDFLPLPSYACNGANTENG